MLSFLFLSCQFSLLLAPTLASADAVGGDRGIPAAGRNRCLCIPTFLLHRRDTRSGGWRAGAGRRDAGSAAAQYLCHATGCALRLTLPARASARRHGSPTASRQRGTGRARCGPLSPTLPASAWISRPADRQPFIFDNYSRPNTPSAGISTQPTRVLILRLYGQMLPLKTAFGCKPIKEKQ